jgi:ClpP class serine protease
MEKSALEDYLSRCSSISTEQIRLITENALFGIETPPAPASDEAVAEIYSLNEASGTAQITISGILSNETASVIDLIFGIQKTSYKTIQAALKKAASDERVKNISLLVNSPGGEVDGLDETWQAIKALNGEKPITVIGSGHVASAAYYLSVAASKIFATSASTLFGSIGIMAAFLDDSERLAADGIRKIKIVSKNAPAKDVLSAEGEGLEALQAELDAIERIFYDRIMQGRGVMAGHITENFGKGGMLVAKDPSAEHKDAIRAGMIDGLTSSTANTFTPIISTPTNVATQAEPDGAAVENNSGFFTAYSAHAEKENFNMTLQEFLGQNPAAKAEVEALKAEAMRTGRDKEKAAFMAKSEKCAVFIAAENYPPTIRKMAAEVLSGKKEMAALEAVVAFADMEAEKTKSAAAQAESAAIGGLTQPKPDGVSAEEKLFKALGEAAISKLKSKREEL